MATDTVKHLLITKLAELRAAHPAADYRLSKSGDSIAEFGPSLPPGTGVMIWGDMIGVDDKIVCTVSRGDGGRPRGVTVPAACYEGFDDPPQTACRFGLGDRVKTDRFHGAEGTVIEVKTAIGADRVWRHRVTIDQWGDGLSTVNSDENAFTLVESASPVVSP